VTATWLGVVKFVERVPAGARQSPVVLVGAPTSALTALEVFRH
jgi:hypothetical protein